MRFGYFKKNSLDDFEMASYTNNVVMQNHNRANMSKIDKMS